MRLTTAITMLLTLTSGTAAAQGAGSSHPSSHSAIKWGPAPAIFPRGAQMAVLQGDPGASGPFTVRLRMPNGYRIAPHTHPTDENVTVISGTLHLGMGNTFETKHMMKLSAGGFVTAPANGAHYVEAHGRTVVQVHALGPFSLTYVNPADTPQPTPSK